MDQLVVSAEAFSDPELELALISAVVADPGCYWQVRERLPAVAADAFTVRREAWEQLAQVIEARAPATASDREMPLPDGLQPTPGPPPTGSDPIEAADRLLELYARRHLARAAEDALKALAAAQPADAVARALAAGLNAVPAPPRDGQVAELTWGDTLLARVTEELAAFEAARAEGRQTTGVAGSGMPSLDFLLSGWQPGGLYVLGGAPGIGKTSLALQWACEAALEPRVVVVFFTCENSPQNLTLKAIGRLGGVSPTALERGRADPVRLREGIERFRAIAQQLAIIPADAGTSIDFVEATTRQALASRGARGLVIVDYLQRLAYGERFSTMTENVSALAQRLRDLAVRLELPVLALSALAPRVDDAPLQLSALAERGELEYASDVVLLLGPRAEVAVASATRARTTLGVRLLDLLVAKNRYGEANRTVPLLFRPATGDFHEESRV